MPAMPASRHRRPLSSNAASAPRAAADAAHIAASVSVTSTGDGHDHRVSDAALDEAGRSGRYRALCGHLVFPAPLVAAPGPVCRKCAAVRAGSGPQALSPGTWARLLRWLGGCSSSLRSIHARIGAPDGE
jgi:hypothetical protein